MRDLCWACAEGFIAASCDVCGAPAWHEDAAAAAGVYVLAAECGMYKIGWSGFGVARRVAALQKEGHERFVVVCVLYAASEHVERWLHGVFGDVRDPSMARAWGLPCHTEWFWPTPSLHRLIAETEFIRGQPWEVLG